MQHKVVLKVSPPSSFARAVAELDHQVEARESGTKMRRTTHEWFGPGTHASMEIVANEPGDKSTVTDVSYICNADLAGLLLCRRAYTENYAVPQALPIVLSLFKAWVRKQYPDLPDNELASITADDCTLDSITAVYYFKFDSETEAFRAFQNLLNHAKVTDSNDSYPHPKSTTKGPRVRSDDGSRHAFTVELIHLPHLKSFGQARVHLARDYQESPYSFGKIAPQLREPMRARARCVLCVEVTVDVSKQLHFGEEATYQLPARYDKWNKDDYPNDPFRIIWEATRYALWLNLPLATDQSDVDRSRLTDGASAVLDAYFAGKNLKRLDWFDDDDAFLDYRKELLDEANIDILIPWVVAQLNLSASLGPRLAYESRFLPGDDPDFADHTLSKKNVAEAIAALRAKLPSSINDDEVLPVSGTSL